MKEKNNKILYIIISIMLIIIILLVAILILVLNKGDKKEIKSSINLGEYNSRIKIDNSVISDYDEYKEYFDSNLVSEKDFKDNNYAIVEVTYDSCSESNILLEDYSIKGENLNVIVTYTVGCGVCAPNYKYFLIPVDKNLNNINLDMEYKRTNDVDCPSDVAYKPIIYLYPTFNTNIKVELGYPEKITTSYPKYNNSWDVFAKVNGDLYDNNTGRYLYGLYWEGNNHVSKVGKTGFVVKGEDTLKFLEEKLAILGLNEREADEFIIYWLPKLENNNYNYIRFESIEEIDTYMPLRVTPNPDTIIRVMMDYKPLDEYIAVEEEKLVPVSRNGFTVVEWGGSIIK